MAAPVDSDLLDLLACPVDREPLSPTEDGALRCAGGHRFPVVDGVPVLLHPDAALAMAGPDRSRDLAERGAPDEWYLDSLGLNGEEKRGIVALARQGGPIDPVVAYLIAATNGLMYRHLIGSLARYPIPAPPLPPGEGRRLLDVGCSWGRWSIAADGLGYRAIGLDPSLGAVMAARRVAVRLGAAARFVVGDARHLPFRNGAFDVALSYSVLQHLSKPDAVMAVEAIGRTLAPGGTAVVQMPNRYGLRCLYHQARRGFGGGRGFDVRYWTPAELRRAFEAAVGRTTLSVDGFFGIGLQATDADLMPAGRRRVLAASEWLKARSRRSPWLAAMADSLWVTAVKAAAGGPA